MTLDLGSHAVGGPDVAGHLPVQRLLDVSDLRVSFRTNDGIVQAVNGISYSLDAGETLAVLGESGAGKSVGVRAVMGIIRRSDCLVTGSVLFNGKQLIGADEATLRRVRGEQMAMIFQDAMSALNPVMSVGDQIAEMFRTHRGTSWNEGRRRAVELLDRVAIPAARHRIGDYPHQFSGGMRQRVMIAMAIALDPAILIADEPTTALDVTVQAQILELLTTLRRDTGMGLILITHDVGVVAEVADRVAVMYAGRIVETGPTGEIYDAAAHPYTRGLLRSAPSVHERTETLTAITGTPPDLMAIPSGCPFSPRCSHVAEVCRDIRPELEAIAVGRSTACHFGSEVLHG
jgi:oligopeptide transport system ATP-binding protein